MNEVSNNEIFNQLLAMSGTIGEIKAGQVSHTRWMEEHVRDDAAVEERVSSLEISRARQRGFVSAMTLLGSLIGAATGTILEYFRHSP